MNGYLTAFSASVTTFAATNVDDAFLLTLLFARRIPTRRIVAGQYIGFGATVAVSLIGAWAAFAIPHRWVRFLGLLPLNRDQTHNGRVLLVTKEWSALGGACVQYLIFVVSVRIW